MATRKCAAVVVGAGPAGVAVMGNLLERQLGPIAWIDPTFTSGRVHSKYREVPSNTKVALFQSFATATQPFQKVIETTPSPNAFTALAQLGDDKTCALGYAADMIRGLTDGLLKMEQVNAFRGIVAAANLNDEAEWTIRIKQNGSPDLDIETTRLILCTGSHPSIAPIPVPGLSIQRLDLDLVLKPTELAKTLEDRPLTIAIVGASHSAILAIMNFIQLARTSHPNLRIKWFTRHPLRYAVPKDGWILRDNTGLKGSAAEFARNELEDDKLSSSAAGKILSKVDCTGGQDIESAQYHRYLPECEYIVQAVGYTRDPMPQLTRNNVPLSMQFQHSTGGFQEVNTTRAIPGLYGAGIAFPERVVDPYGNVEFAVGFFKFMKFLKRVVPSWVKA
ncbi:unnamed protein product [Penicillium bialowiezense]